MNIDLIAKYFVDERKSLYEISKIINMPMSQVRLLANVPSIIGSRLAEFCKLNRGKRVLIFDLETTGLPKTKGFDKFYKYDCNDAYDSSRIIQLSYSMYNLGVTLETDLVIHNYYRYPTDEIMISDSSYRVHHITREHLVNYGIPFVNIINDGFIDALNQCDYIISHNIKFDFNVLLNELYRINYNIPKEWDNKLVCTCKLTDFTKLCTLYQIMVGKEDLNFHDASSDVLALYRILCSLSTTE